MSRMGPEPVTGAGIRAANTALNRRLAALGVVTSSRYDMTPRLDSWSWEKLTALAELGKEWQATAEICADPAEAARLRQALKEAAEGRVTPWEYDDGTGGTGDTL